MVRGFCAAEMAPLVADAEETETLPRPLVKRRAKVGLLGVRHPVADGGSDGDKVSDVQSPSPLSSLRG